MPILYIRIFQFKKYKSQLNVIYQWFTSELIVVIWLQNMVFVLLCCFFFALVIILQILTLKHTLQLNYYFQVHASQCCSHVSHLQFKLQALL